MHPITIISPLDPGLTARVCEVDSGVEVTFWRRDSNPLQPPSRIGRLGRQVLDAPFHVALDLAHDLMRDGAIR